MPKPTRIRQTPSDLWRRPIDLTPELATRLLHDLAVNHRHRLELMVRQGGRATMHELLTVTNDTDLRVLSYFQGALSRKLRRLLGDREKKIHLIGWDYETTEWDAQHNMIIGGVCYLTEATVRSLRECFGHPPGPATTCQGVDWAARYKHGAW